ncbi:MAG: hypothetical protein DRP96_11520 [Candidatus Neomarinimicrobiota bacterium]|nr:MAG: hypothetical protein DRP96_11520 [Candidatus Neomarinimicrobiota bacterium]
MMIITRMSAGSGTVIQTTLPTVFTPFQMEKYMAIHVSTRPMSMWGTIEKAPSPSRPVYWSTRFMKKGSGSSPQAMFRE